MLAVFSSSLIATTRDTEKTRCCFAHSHTLLHVILLSTGLNYDDVLIVTGSYGRVAGLIPTIRPTQLELSELPQAIITSADGLQI